MKAQIVALSLAVGTAALSAASSVPESYEYVEERGIGRAIKGAGRFLKKHSGHIGTAAMIGTAVLPASQPAQRRSFFEEYDDEPLSARSIDFDNDYDFEERGIGRAIKGAGRFLKKHSGHIGTAAMIGSSVLPASQPAQRRSLFAGYDDEPLSARSIDFDYDSDLEERGIGRAIKGAGRFLKKHSGHIGTAAMIGSTVLPASQPAQRRSFFEEYDDEPLSARSIEFDYDADLEERGIGRAIKGAGRFLKKHSGHIGTAAMIGSSVLPASQPAQRRSLFEEYDDEPLSARSIDFDYDADFEERGIGRAIKGAGRFLKKHSGHIGTAAMIGSSVLPASQSAPARRSFEEEEQDMLLLGRDDFNSL